MDPNYYNHNATNSDSSSSEECAVCLEKVHKVDMYAKIDSDNEADKKYHPHCLNKWFSRSTLGLISRENVDSYSIFSAKVPIDQVSVTSRNNRSDRDHPDNIDEHAVLINNDTIVDDGNNDNANEEVDTTNQSHVCRKIVVGAVVPFVIFIILAIIAYFIFQ